MTGHKTENVHRRYAIVSGSDVAEGIAKLAALEPSGADSGLKIVSARSPVRAD